jgi:predicted phosphoribosyltransferase
MNMQTSTNAGESSSHNLRMRAGCVALEGSRAIALGAGTAVVPRAASGHWATGKESREDAIDAVAARELRELERRERAYRDNRPAPDVQGQTIILVDDGIATGSTMRAAVEALRQLEAARVVVAAPTAALSTAREMQPEWEVGEVEETFPTGL